MKRAALLLTIALACTSAQQRSYDAVQRLNAGLLASSSATRVLETWCGATVTAVRAPGVRKEPDAEQLQRLGVHDAGEVRYRRVDLRCNGRVLSVADNWYVPARLTAEMNALLETTDTPFGKVVAPLHPYRRTIRATILWTPPAPMPQDVLQHRAVLYTSGGVPFAEVIETYQRELVTRSPARPSSRTAPSRSP
jgi:chorismate-pyruvate lyase